MISGLGAVGFACLARLSLDEERVEMTFARKLAVLAVVCAGGLHGSAWAQASAASQLTDTPVAPPNTEAVRLAGIAKDNSRHFGSDPDNPGPIATDLSPAMTPQAVGAAMKKVADWQMKESEPYFSKVEKPLLDGRIWTWSVLYSGFMAASESLGDARYRDAMEAMGKSYNWDARSKRPGADDEAVEQTYIELYLLKKDPAMLGPTKVGLDEVMAHPWVAGPNKPIEWWWCDALFMAPPLWARMYKATGDKKYLTYLDAEWAKTSDLLYDPVAHLYARDVTFIPKTEKNGQKMFWSRGEGWVMGGLSRTLEYLPKDDPARTKYETQLKEMAGALAKIQGADGLWRPGLLDPADWPQPEISGSALITFGMAYGVNNGLLDRKTYEPVIAKAWAGMLKHVYADGRLGDIQQTGAEPMTYKPSASYTYGVGGFLLAGSEIRKMEGKK
jgi:unsaturated rhamnogalacturonyl hydrolase